MRKNNLKNNPKFTDGKFRVMLVGDPHEISADESPKDKNRIYDYLTFQYAAIEKLKPQLVILMGDNAQGDSEEDLEKTLRRITKPYVEKNIPFAFVLGNHDLECKVNDIKKQYEIYRRLPGCLLPEKTEISPYGDYYVTVKNENGDKDAYNFWLMYSGNKAEKQYYINYDFVKPEQIKWYEENAQKLKEINGEVVPSTVIQHIPVLEEFELLKECSFMSMLTDGVYGQNEQKGKFYRLNKAKATGYMGEAPCASGYNSGQFASWKKTGDVRAAFFGHDHMNDFFGDVDGILLGQCKTAGFRPYGDGLMQGVRIIDLQENDTDTIDTKMVYYRDIVGNDCKSIHGSEKVLRDRTSVKLDVLKKIALYSLPVAVPLTIYKTIRKFGK